MSWIRCVHVITPGGFSVSFQRYARVGKNFVTIHTDIFAWKMYPLYWNIQKIPPQNAPIFMKCTENLAQNSTHLYAIRGTNFIQRYTSLLKIYRMLSGKILPTVIKCTGNRTVKDTHSDKIYKTCRFFIRRVVHNEWILTWIPWSKRHKSPFSACNYLLTSQEFMMSCEFKMFTCVLTESWNAIPWI